MAHGKHRKQKSKLDMLGRHPVAVAVETTGLRVEGGDELLAVAACTFDGRTLCDVRVRPAHHDGGWPEAERFNGISPDDVAGCPPLPSVLPDLAAALVRSSAFVVYSDLAIRAICASGIALQQRPVVDVRDEYASRHGRWDKTSRKRIPVKLDDCAAHYGIDAPAKGDTLGRAQCIASCLNALLDENRQSEAVSKTVGRQMAQTGSGKVYVSNLLSDIYVREAAASDGIFLVDAPTGAGKTWAEADAAARIVTDPAFAGRKVVCTAPENKQLLDPGEVEARIRAHGGTVGPHDVVIVRNRTDMLADTVRLPAAVPPEGTDGHLLDAYGVVRRCAGDYIDARQEAAARSDARSDVAARAVRQYFEQTKDALDDAGRNLEKAASRILAREAEKLADERTPDGRTPSERDIADCRAELFAGPGWSWVGELFPSARIADARVVITTWAKFNSKVNTIVSGAADMCELDVLDGAVVFADEGDECKSQAVGGIAEAAARSTVDMVELSRSIADASARRSLPSLARRADDDEKRSRWRDYRRDMAADAAELHLRVPYKTAEGVNKGGGFLFNYDGGHVTVGAGRGGFSCRYSADDHAVMIDADAGDDGEAIELNRCVARMRGMASYSQRMIAGRSFTVLNRRRKNDGRVQFTPGQALDSTLEVFGFTPNRPETAYMRAGAQRDQKIVNPHFAQADDSDMSFYARGFSCTFLEDGESHAMNTRLDTAAVQDSAEAQLAAVASHMRVFLISATMQVPSVLSNWNFGYLRSHDVAVETAGGNDRRRLADAWRVQTAADRDEVRLDIEPVDCGDGVRSVDEWRTLWVSLFDGDGAAVDAAFSCIRRAMPFSDEPRDKPHYDMRRYYQVAYVFAGFLAHPEMRSCLCLMMSVPKAAGTWCRSVLIDVLAVVMARVADLPPAEASGRVGGLVAVVSDSRSYDAEMAAVRDRLAGGGRAFVIAAYGTMGTGIETQYPIPEDVSDDSLVRRDGPAAARLKDFDCAYFGGIRQLVPKPDGRAEGRYFIGVNVNIAELMENGEISMRQRRKAVAALAKARTSGDSESVRAMKRTLGRFDSTPSACGKALRTLQQAFGRTNRAPYRLDRQIVWYDASLAERIDPDMVDMELAHPAFAALVDDIASRRQAQAVAIDELRNNRASIKARNAASFIDRLLGGTAGRGFWDDREMEQWRALRGFLLEHGPVLDSLDDVPQTLRRPVREFWVDAGDEPVDRLWYGRGGRDYGGGTVVSLTGPDPDLGARSEESAHAARLDIVASVPELRALFERNGWSLGWKPARYIASPPLFTNIYLGAVGEACVRELMQDRVPGLVLEDIGDGAEFEKFDFRVAGRRNFYVDAKHWRESSDVELGSELRKIGDKMSSIGAEKVVVANLFAPSDGDAYRPEVYDAAVVPDGIGRVLVIPGLLDADGGRRYDWVPVLAGFLGMEGGARC